MFTKFRKIILLLTVLPFMIMLPCTSQTVETISGSEQTIVNMTSEEMFDMFKSDMFEGIFGAILDHIWVVLLIIIAILVILYMIIHYITKIFMFISTKFSSTEYIQFGKLKIKNKSYVSPNVANQSNIESILKTNISGYVSLLSIYLKTSIKNIFEKTSEIYTNLNDLDKVYETRCSNIFHETFTNVMNEFRDLLIAHCIEVTGFSLIDIHKTREYFFINELLTSIEKEWERKSKDIIIRNGFEHADNDIDYIRKYIDELHQCVISSINYRYLESIDIVRQNLLDIINKCFETTDPMFEKMFKDLSKLKMDKIQKHNSKMKHIDSIVDSSIDEIIDTASTKLAATIFNKAINTSETKEKSEEKEDDSEKDEE